MRREPRLPPGWWILLGIAWPAVIGLYVLVTWLANR